ncbi:AraC family transcriptional regulator [Paenibacillus sp. S150]|uniref:AraC family transcriptional regulator n=1 Tax=Paenibacillus sp. S150 TaxID=2749826 RepID=UPI001C593A08|nr:AraC family transcriptional regulator [Paenibacillus sp. S150]MBW4080684.1 AraC family transcriptional regulator [Paenibacillus sp. S150]
MESTLIFCETEEMAALPLYATTIGFWEHQTEMERPGGFPDYQLHQVLEGKGELFLKDKRYIVEPGDVFFLFPHVAHAYAPVSGEWMLSWVSFNGREAGSLLTYAGIRESGTGRLNALPLLEPLHRMLELSHGNTLEINLERSKLMYALMLELKLQLSAPAGGQDELERMKPVLQHIEHNLHRPLTLKELAETASISPQYLCRLFQRTLHERPVAYINKQRINRSKQLMFSGREKKIYEIAGQAGFENVGYFCAVFKRITGMRPDEFKQLHGLDGRRL